MVGHPLERNICFTCKTKINAEKLERVPKVMELRRNPVRIPADAGGGRKGG